MPLSNDTFVDQKIDLIRHKINCRLDEYFNELSGVNETLLESMKYSINSGGKRLRPCMTVMFYELCGGKSEKIYDVACSVEMVHTYSLIHDDLPCMDDDYFRRGKKSTHAVYGEDMALLAGDALLTQAFELLTDNRLSNEFGEKSIIELVRTLSEMAGTKGMISGQCEDIMATDSNGSDEKSLLGMYEKKTGRLFSASSKMGAICAGGRFDKLQFAEEFGKFFGVSFQIFDDIIDLEKDEKSKVTYASLYGREKAESLVKEYSCKAKKIIEQFDGDSAPLKRLIDILL